MAESPDSKASKSLTFRLPNEIYSELEQFAIAKGLVKSDGAIKTTDALITVIKQGLGLSHSVSQNVSISNVDIQGMIDKAITPLIARIENLEYDPMRSTFHSEAVSKKDSEVVSKSEGDRIEEITASSLDPNFSERPHAKLPDTTPLLIEKSLTDAISSKEIAYASKLKITYKRNHDGSVMLKSIRGIELKDFKKLSEGELKALGLYRESIGVTTKYWEIQADQLEGKAIATTVSLADRRFTLKEAAEYYSAKSGKPMSENSLRTNSRKYGFAILEKGSGKYALIDA